MRSSLVINALKSSGRSCPASSEMTRTVALGILNSRQIVRMTDDSISTASRGCFLPKRPLFSRRNRDATMTMELRRNRAQFLQLPRKARVKILLVNDGSELQRRIKPAGETGGDHALRLDPRDGFADIFGGVFAADARDPNLNAARLPGFAAEKFHFLFDGKTDQQINRGFDQPAHRAIPVVMQRHDGKLFQIR